MDSRLLTVRQLAEQFNCSPDFIYSLTYARKIPFVKIGRAIRFDPRKIDRWLDENSVGGDGWGR